MSAVSLPVEPRFSELRLSLPFLTGAELAQVSTVSRALEGATAGAELWRGMVARDFPDEDVPSGWKEAYKKLAEEELREEIGVEEGFCDSCRCAFLRLPWEDSEAMPGVTWCSGEVCSEVGERRGWHENEDPSMQCDGCGGWFCSECTQDYDSGQGYARCTCTHRH
jgi:hypothetical protein